jgi:microcystin-dependent protein
MSTPYIGQIDMFGGNFAPKHYALCNGQLMSITQNQALFSLIGTAYGGNGISTFALPNLQSSLPVHMGTGPGLSHYAIGQVGGSTSVTLSIANIPQHNHMLDATQADADTTTIGPSVILATTTGDSAPLFYANPEDGQPPLTLVPMAVNACGFAGQSQSHSNLMPSLCITFIIALQGIFPSRN